MNRKLFTFFTLLVISFHAYSQGLTQTVRGVVLDTDSKSPLVGVHVTLLDSDPIVGAVSDVNGNFRLNHVAIGRISLKISYMGYKNQIIPDIMVISAKETVLVANRIHNSNG